MLKDATPHADIDNVLIARYIDELELNTRLKNECQNAPLTTFTGTGAETINPIFTLKDQSEKRLLAIEKALGIGANNRVKFKNESEQAPNEMLAFLSGN